MLSEIYNNRFFFQMYIKNSCIFIKIFEITLGIFDIKYINKKLPYILRNNFENNDFKTMSSKEFFNNILICKIMEYI